MHDVLVCNVPDLSNYACKGSHQTVAFKCTNSCTGSSSRITAYSTATAAQRATTTTTNRI
jgi:hypothetical protein